jgi:CheY-like chemotaxis protein
VTPSPSILIVDDEPDLREAIAFDFRRKGFRVLLAGSGNEAIRKLEAEPVDVVLSDVRMPDGDGMHLLDWIKNRNEASPAVMLITGFADISVEEAYDRGADAIFAKPFERKALMDAVQRAIQPSAERLLRRSPRVETDMPVGLKFLRSGFEAQTHVSNLGRGGFFVLLEKAFPETGETVEFRLESSHLPKVEIDGAGIVRWVRKTSDGSQPPGCGIEFTGLEKNCVRQVTELVNFLKTRSFIPRA